MDQSAQEPQSGFSPAVLLAIKRGAWSGQLDRERCVDLLGKAGLTGAEARQVVGDWEFPEPADG